MASDEHLYLIATNEADSDIRNSALWAKCMALCEGNEVKAKYLYINERVEALRTENKNKSKKLDVESSSEERPFFNRLIDGDYGLAKTYWLYGVVVGVFVNFIANMITSVEGYVILMLGYTVYEIPVLLGTWHAADNYTGSNVWAVLAKIAVVLGWFWLGVGLFFVFKLVNV